MPKIGSTPRAKKSPLKSRAKPPETELDIREDLLPLLKAIHTLSTKLSILSDRVETLTDSISRSHYYGPYTDPARIPNDDVPF